LPAGCDATVVIALSTVAGAAPPPGPLTVPAAAGSATETLDAPARYAFQAQLVVAGVAGPWSTAQQFTVLPLDYCMGWVRPPSSSPVSGRPLDPTDALLSVDVGPQDPLHVTLCGAPTAIASAVGDPTAPIVRFPAGSTPSAVAAGLTPGRTYRWQVYVNDTVYGTVTVTQPPAAGGCQVDLRVTAAWSTYHVISGTVTAAGSAALTGWRVSWPANGTITQVWNAVLGGDPTAQVTTVGNAPYNGAVPAGQTATFGFVVDGGTWGGVTPAGLTCTPATS
jgi:cellulose binding protein with CBM2 domain